MCPIESTSPPPAALIVAACVVAAVDAALLTALPPMLPDLSDRYDVSGTAVGVFAGALGAGLFLAAIPSGLVVGRLGARTTTILALVLEAGASVLFGLVHRFDLLVVARFLEGIGSALAWTALFAWLLGAAPATHRGRLVGLTMGATFAGVTAGPAIGAAAIGLGLAPVFVLLAVLFAVVALALLRVADVPQAPEGVGTYIRMLRRRDTVAALWIVGLPGLLGALAAIVISYRLSDLGAGADLIGAVFVVTAALQAVTSAAYGRLVDAVGALRPLRHALAAVAVFALLGPLVHSQVSFVAVSIGLWLAISTTVAPGLVMMSETTDRAAATVPVGFALVNLAWAFAYAVGSLAAGAIRGAAGDATTLALVAAVAAASILVMRPRVPVGESC